MALFYLYIFKWDEVKYYVYAESEKEAIKRFEEETGLNQKPEGRKPW